MKTILVAEDHPANLELITEMLEAAGCRVIQALDGQYALDLLRIHRPDVVLLDLQMPRMDGWETMRAIRQDPNMAGLPVIACTAYAMQGDREQILTSGFDGYISKPISRAQLLEMVRAHCGS